MPQPAGVPRPLWGRPPLCCPRGGQSVRCGPPQATLNARGDGQRLLCRLSAVALGASTCGTRAKRWPLAAACQGGHAGPSRVCVSRPLSGPSSDWGAPCGPETAWVGQRPPWPCSTVTLEMAGPLGSHQDGDCWRLYIRPVRTLLCIPYEVVSVNNMFTAGLAGPPGV